MPVLMNKGADPRKAAWLFYTDRATLDALGTTAARERYDAGALTVDTADLDAAPKASSEVPVYLAVATLVPDDFDLSRLEELARQADGASLADGGAAACEGREAAGEVVDQADRKGSGTPGGVTGRTRGETEGPTDGRAAGGVAAPLPDGDGQVAAADDGEGLSTGTGAGEPAAPLYEPVPAPEGTRIPVGTTTAAAARAYLQPREVDGRPWAAELPGLQMLVALIASMRDHGGLPEQVVWHVDPQGILRMAPAKQVKPMAGNVLKCKL